MLKRQTDAALQGLKSWHRKYTHTLVKPKGITSPCTSKPAWAASKPSAFDVSCLIGRFRMLSYLIYCRSKKLLEDMELFCIFNKQNARTVQHISSPIEMLRFLRQHADLLCKLCWPAKIMFCIIRIVFWIFFFHDNAARILLVILLHRQREISSYSQRNHFTLSLKSFYFSSH